MNTSSKKSRCAPVRGSLACALSIFATAAVIAYASAMAQTSPGAPGAAAEQSPQLTEVIVTAQKREENAKDVPMTITVFNQAAIEEHGFTGLSDYAKYVPGMIYNGAGSEGGDRSGPDIVIRGIANSRLLDQETNIGTATTGFVYGEMPAYSFDPELVDIQRIEVLKGPQGTLYGAAAMGGLVKVVPNPPDFTQFSGAVVGGVSALDNGGGAGGNGWNVATVMNMPLSDVLAFRFSFHASQDPGYINIHLLTGNPNDQYGPNGLTLAANAFGTAQLLKDANKSEAGGGRAALRFKPDDRFDATLAFMFDSKQTDSLSNYEPALSTSTSPRTANQFQLQPESTNYSLASLEASYDFGWAVLHSISGWLDRRYSNSFDFTGVTYGALGGNGVVPAPTPSAVTFNPDTRIVSQELRLQGEVKDLIWTGSGLDWTVGVFYQRESRDVHASTTVGAAWLTEAQAPLKAPPSGTPTVWDNLYTATYTNKAAFADLTFHITPQVAVSVGARDSSQNLEATRTDFSDVFASAPPNGYTSVQEPASQKKTTKRATVTYAPSDEVNLYAAYSEGFRIGGYNPTQTLTTPSCEAALQKFGVSDPAAVTQFKSDSVKDYEVGIKSAMAGGRIIANLTAFRVDWTNIQSTIVLAELNLGCGGTFVGNAGAARINGLDGELRAQVTDHLQVALSGQYADGKIVSVPAGSSGVLGAPLEATPKTQVTAGVAYRVTPRPEWQTTARLDYAYVGARNMNSTNTPLNPAYLLPGYGELNLRFSAVHDDWEYTPFVNNLTNTIPQLGVYLFPGGPGNYSGAFAPGAQRFVTTSAPRTFGIMVRKKF